MSRKPSLPPPSPSAQMVLRWAHPASLRKCLAGQAEGEGATARSCPAPIRHEMMTPLALSNTVDQVAAGLAGLGIQPGDRVLLYLPLSWQLFVALLSVQRLGAVPALLDPDAHPGSLAPSVLATFPER